LELYYKRYFVEVNIGFGKARYKETKIGKKIIQRQFLKLDIEIKKARQII